MGCTSSRQQTNAAAGENSREGDGRKRKRRRQAKTPKALLSDHIDEELKSMQTSEKKKVKVLLLGAGESGKSTILKQLKVIHLEGFSQDELLMYKNLIRYNTLSCIQVLCQATRYLGLESDPANEDAIHRIMSVSAESLVKGADSELLRTLLQDTKQLWDNDPGIMLAFEQQNQFHLLDSCAYFMRNVDRILGEDYVPETSDVVRSRLKTTGINHMNITVDELSMDVYDVGGQRGERRKWIHCFDDVTAMMFIAALSEYDLVLEEARSRNRMTESLALWEAMVNLPWFDESSVILFLNKVDIFKEKIQKVALNEYFPEYTGGSDWQKGVAFIQNLFLVRNKRVLDRTIYTHVTDATNTNNIKFVWAACKQTIMHNMLTDGALAMC